MCADSDTDACPTATRYWPVSPQRRCCRPYVRVELVGDERGCVWGEIRCPLIPIAEDTEPLLNGPQRAGGATHVRWQLHMLDERRVEVLEDLPNRRHLG